MSKDDEQPQAPPLGATYRDRGVSLVRGAIGAVPFAGGIISAIIGEVIPQQRTQRIESYLRYLNDRLDSVAPEKLGPLKEPENVELFEEGAMQAARALSDERRAQIARLVAHGMSGDEKERIEAKRLLNIFNQIDDDQIIILMSYLGRYARDQDFRSKNAEILRPERPHINSTDDVREKWVVAQIAHDSLVRLGLLGQHFGIQKKDQSPQFDYKTGMLKLTRLELTTLGRLLLQRLELAGPKDW
jgi:hypothetical protein